MSMLRVSEAAHRNIKEIASRKGMSLQAVIDDIVEDYRRREFLIQANADYEKLISDPGSWQDEVEERKIWDATLMDGLDSE